MKINDNAYKGELSGDYGVSTTFNVSDLSPYQDDEPLDSRMSPFNQGRMMNLSSPSPIHLMMHKSPM